MCRNVTFENGANAPVIYDNLKTMRFTIEKAKLFGVRVSLFSVSKLIFVVFLVFYGATVRFGLGDAHGVSCDQLIDGG